MRALAVTSSARLPALPNIPTSEGRYIFIGEVLWLSARHGLVDTERWRVNLRDFHPVARFGASFYIRTSDRFEIKDTQDAPGHGENLIDQL